MSADTTGLFAVKVWELHRCLECGALIHTRDISLHINWHANLPIPVWHRAVAYPAEVTLVPLNTADPNDPRSA